MKYIKSYHILLIAILLLQSAASQTALAKPQNSSTQNAQQLLEKANQAFLNANQLTGQQAKQAYEKAILAYKTIIDRHDIKNAGLYYNLANAYLLSDQLGQAILNYRRALELDPTDTNIKKNLAYARSKKYDKIPPRTRQRVLQTLFFWHYDFSLRARMIAAIIVFSLFCLILALRPWLKAKTFTAGLSAIILLVFAAFAISVIIEQVYQNKITEGVIIAKSVKAYQGDGRNYPQSFTEPLHEGTEFILLEKRSGWLHIKLANATDTWIPQNAAEMI